jgi:hypothetical protein
MISPMKPFTFSRRMRHVTLAAVTTAMLSLTAAPAHAQSDDEEKLPDARLMGYEKPINVKGGTMGTYLLLALLGLLAVGITFKSANRSHLD